MKVRYDDGTFMEIMEEFREKFLRLMETLEARIISLQGKERYLETVEELFREIHSLKALALYLELDPIVRALHAVEGVLDALKHKQPPARQEVVDWLLLLVDHFVGWAEEIEEGPFDPLPVDAYTLNMVRLSPIALSRSGDPLEGRIVLLLDPNPKHREALAKRLGKRVRKVCPAAAGEELAEVVSRERPDMALVAAEAGGEALEETVALLGTLRPRTPVAVLTGKEVTKPFLRTVGTLDVDTMLPKNLDASRFMKKLERLAEIHYDKRWLLVHDKQIASTIARLGPLSKTVTRIRNAPSGRWPG